MSEEHKTRRPLIDKIGEVVTQYPGWGSTVDFSYSPGNYENLNLFLRILEGPEDELEELTQKVLSISKPQREYKDFFEELIRRGAGEKIISILKRVDSKNLPIWNNIFYPLALNGFPSQVLELLEKMDLNTTITDHALVITLEACCQYGEAQKVCLLLSKIDKTFLLSSLEKRNSELILYIALNGEAEYAFKLLESIVPEKLSKWENIFDTFLKDSRYIDQLYELFLTFPKKDLTTMPRLLKEAGFFHRGMLMLGILINAEREMQIKTKKSDTLDPEIESVLNEALSSLSFPELIFFDLVAKRHGIFSEEVMKMLAFGRFIVEIDKDGSRLFIMKRKQNGGEISIVNEIYSGPVKAWEKIVEHNIPTAPIYKVSKERKNGKKRVFSRFCGIARRHLYNIDPKLNAIIEEKAEAIKAKLEQIQVNHNHPHLGNFVVEFIDKTYFQTQTAPPNSYTVNTIPWKEEAFSYSVLDYGNDPEKWEVVVRIIDLDQAAIKKEKS